MKQKIVIIIILVLLTALVLLVDQKSNISQTNDRAEEEVAGQESMNNMVGAVYSEAHIGGLEVFKDDGLISFYENDLQKKCPFYEPNGANYRECVAALIEEEGLRFSQYAEILKNIENYCSEGAEKTADSYTLGYVDIYNTCVLYKMKTTNINY